MNPMQNNISNNPNNIGQNNNFNNNLNNNMMNNFNNMNNMNMNNFNSMMNNMSLNNTNNNNQINNMNNNMPPNMINNMNANNMNSSMNNNINANNMNNNMNNNMINNMSNNMSNNMNSNMSNNMNANNMNNNMNNNISNNMSNNMNANNMNNNMNMNNNNQNYGYAKVVLQALHALNYFKFKLFLDEKTNQNIIKDFTNSFKFLFSSLFTNISEQYFTKVMNIYNQSQSINSTPKLPNPYSFLKNIMEILKEENQVAIMQQNEQFNSEQDWKNKRYDVEKCFKLCRHNIRHYEKSFISDCLYFIRYEMYFCNQCRQYFRFSLLPMIEIDLNQYTAEGAPKYYIKTYINHYFNKQFPTICKVCNNQANIQYKMMFNSSILIIHFYRNDPTKPHNTEINPDINLNLKNNLFKYPNIYPYEDFVLKGYISYDDQIGYFFDYNFKIDNDNFIWIRYNNDNYTQINNQYINNCKPILVFYEAKSDKRPEPPKTEKNPINMNQPIQTSHINPNNSQAIFNQNNPNIRNVGNMGNMNNNFQRNSFGMNNFNMMGTGPINQMMPMNTMNPQNMMQMQQHQMQMQMIQQSQMNMQMQQNMNLLNQQQLMNRANQILNSGDNINNAANSGNSGTGNSGNQNNDNQNNLNVIFYVVPESNLNDETNKIALQIKKEEKINEIYKKLLVKLTTDNENYIKKIIFNNNEISKTSTQKASEFNFTNDCKVIAVKNEAVAN